MKNFVKGLATGLVISFMLTAVPVFAKGIDVVLNGVRISLSGINQVQWGEGYTLDNGSTVPYSILYEGTIYLPLRKIGDLNGKQVYWNGDTKTATMTEYFSSYPPDAVTLATEKDANENQWIYQVEKDSAGQEYLHISDSDRNFSRIYKLIAGKNKADKFEYSLPVVVDDGIIFSTSLNGINAQTRKILFKSNADTQDGAVISEGGWYDVFGGLLITYGPVWSSDGSTGAYIAEAVNIKTGGKAEIKRSAGIGPMAFLGEITGYENGYLTFEIAPDSLRQGPIHRYRISIQLADTPIVGEIEDLGEV